MTNTQHQMLQDLKSCTFRVASPEKRFVREVSALPREHELTEKQALHVLRLHHRFRRQIKSHRCTAECNLFIGEVRRARIALEEAQKLEGVSLRDYWQKDWMPPAHPRCRCWVTVSVSAITGKRTGCDYGFYPTTIALCPTVANATVLEG